MSDTERVRVVKITESTYRRLEDIADLFGQSLKDANAKCIESFWDDHVRDQIDNLRQVRETAKKGLEKSEKN